jgi:hypothetical protein
MKVKLAAIVAEIARTIDRDLLAFDTTFAILSRPHRMSLILTSLQRENVASAGKSRRDVVCRWDPSERLLEYLGAEPVGINDEFEDVQCPTGIFSAADEFARILRMRPYLVAEIASSVIRRFQMHNLGLLEYCGKKAGFCIFRKSKRCIEVMEKNADVREFIKLHSRS